MEQDTEWSGDIRPGWLVKIAPDPDGFFKAVRNRDGHVEESRTRRGLLAGMVASDVVRTWREAGMV